MKAQDFRLLRGSESLTDYQHKPASMPEPFLHLNFCTQCGIRPFTRGGVHPGLGGAFYAVNVAALDDASDEELEKAPIHYADGRHDDWSKTAEHRFI